MLAGEVGNRDNEHAEGVSQRRQCRQVPGVISLGHSWSVVAQLRPLLFHSDFSTLLRMGEEAEGLLFHSLCRHQRCRSHAHSPPVAWLACVCDVLHCHLAASVQSALSQAYGKCMYPVLSILSL